MLSPDGAAEKSSVSPRDGTLNAADESTAGSGCAGQAAACVAAAGVGMSLIVLIYVTARISFDLGGVIAMVLTLGAFVLIEAFLFWATRLRENSAG
jgi:hypothetical protein